MRYLLDTNILIAAMKGNDNVRARLELTPVNQILISPIVLGELQLGVEKSAQRARNAACLASLIAFRAARQVRRVNPKAHSNRHPQMRHSRMAEKHRLPFEVDPAQAGRQFDHVE